MNEVGLFMLVVGVNGIIGVSVWIARRVQGEE